MCCVVVALKLPFPVISPGARSQSAESGLRMWAPTPPITTPYVRWNRFRGTYPHPTSNTQKKGQPDDTLLSETKQDTQQKGKGDTVHWVQIPILRYKKIKEFKTHTSPLNCLSQRKKKEEKNRKRKEKAIHSDPETEPGSN